MRILSELQLLKRMSQRIREPFIFHRVQGEDNFYRVLEVCLHKIRLRSNVIQHSQRIWGIREALKPSQSTLYIQ